MNTNKIVFFLALFSISLVSCNNIELREEIENYFEKVNFDSAKKNTKTIKLTSSFEVKENNKITSYRYTTLEASLEEENYYYNIHEQYLGIYAEGGTNDAIKEIYFDSDDKNYHMYENYDNKVNENIVEVSYVEETLTRIFYSSDNSGLKTGGLFYGDDIKQLYRFQDFMIVDEDTNELTLTIENFVTDDVTNSYSYTLNQYGMLLSYDLISYNSLKTLTGTIRVSYNEIL